MENFIRRIIFANYSIFFLSFFSFFVANLLIERNARKQEKKKKKINLLKNYIKKKKREKFISKFIYVKEKSVERKFWIFQICRFEIYEIFKQIHRHMEILHEKKKKKRRKKKKERKKNIQREISLVRYLSRICCQKKFSRVTSPLSSLSLFSFHTPIYLSICRESITL